MRARWLGLLVPVVGCASSTPDTPVPVTIEVPIQVISNVVLVAASVNGGQSAILLVDTGTSWTILTFRLLKRLEVVVPADAPRRQLTVLGGEKLDVPFIEIATITIGDAVVKDQEVGVHDIDPNAPSRRGCSVATFSTGSE